MATESNDEQLKRLIQIRRGNRSVITKLENEVSATISNISSSQTASSSATKANLTAKIESISTSLRQKQQYIKELNDQIIEQIDVQQIEKEIEETTVWDSKVFELINKIEQIKLGSYSPQRQLSSTQSGQFANNAQQEEQEGGSPFNSSFVSQHTGIRLPKINLPKFGGDITEFNAFWQSFECAVHANESINGAHKLNYLMNLLEGPAYRVVAGLDITEENYIHAVETLKTRFGNKQRIISAHMQALLKLQELPNEKVSHLRTILDKINIHVRGLESLGMPQESYGSLLIPIIMQRMPGEITVQVARKVTEDIWPIKEILDIIRREIEARELSESVSVSRKTVQQPPKVSFGTTKSFVSKGNTKETCYLCSKGHLTIECTEVTDVNKRTEILKKAKRCFKCLKTGHLAKECERKCKKCGGGHHQIICFKSKEKSVAEQAEQASVTTMVNDKKQILLQTAKAYALAADDVTKIPITILFDSGSQRSYVSEAMKKKLSLPSEHSEIMNINTFGTDKHEKKICKLVTVRVDVAGQIVSVKALAYHTICSPISARVTVSEYPHLRGLHFADSVEESEKHIDLLIGADHYYEFITGEIIKGHSGPVAVNSRLGWLLSGPSAVENHSISCTNVNSNLVLDRSPHEVVISDSELGQDHESTKSKEIIESLREFWYHESLGLPEIDNIKTPDKCGDSEEADQGEQFDITFNGTRYEVGLPWRSDISNESISDNFDLCSQRLKSLHSRLKNDPALFNEYNAIFQEQLRNGIIERVPDNSTFQGKLHYLCHHGVVRKDHETTKLRIVFDGSQKSGSKQLSLNDMLVLGDNFMPSLFDTLIRFRAHSIALTADIEKAFLQIEIKESDRDSLRFLWFDNIAEANPSVVTFRWCRLAFGLKPSPSILGATIKQHISLFQDEYPEVVKVLSHLYADDLSCGVDSREEALNLYKTSKEILAKGGFNLRKWKTNDKALLASIKAAEGSEGGSSEKSNEPPVSEDKQSYSDYSMGLPTADQATKILGVNWHPQTDELFFNLQQIYQFAEQLPPTKRSLLKVAAKVFDPLGCLSLFTIKLKVFFQELCIEKVPWDEPLSGDNLKRYDTLLSEANNIKGIKVPRSFVKPGERVKSVEIHAFSDASEQAYACVIYLRVLYESGEVEIHFVASKAKVAPIKKQSIPRLELLGATLMSRLVDSVRKVLQEEFPHTTLRQFYWVDSMATLCWIKNNRVWQQFVRHRVNEILSISNRDEWFYCPGPQNPADLPSRGKSGSSLQTNFFWWQGATFLRSDPSEWPQPPKEFISTNAMEEKVKNEPEVTYVMVNSQEPVTLNLQTVFDIHKHSNKGKLLRTLSWVLRFIDNLKARLRGKSVNKENEISGEETDRAEMVLIKSIQSKAFIKELHYLFKDDKEQTKAPLYVSQFNLFLDTHRVLRCRSRVSKSSVIDSGKNPILLPPGHHYAFLLIKEAHKEVYHNGTRETLNLLRQTYWVPRGREMVKKFVRKCLLCKKLEGLPFRTSFNPDLPPDRVDDSPPFTNTGLDFAGPLIVKYAAGSKKCYICLFTCMSTRAIHLELVESLEVDAFIRAFRRFCGRRGLPSTLWSDNAKTFKSASKEVKRLVTSPRLHEFLSSKAVRWKFITEKSPWEGGTWERLIRSIKRCIIKVIGRAFLDFHEMRTILVEVEGVINSRPLTYVHDDTEGISYPLTPSHLINGRNLLHLPQYRYEEIVSIYETLSKRAKYNRLLLGQFTRRWRNEYLLGLMEAYRPTQVQSKPNVQVGDVVLLKDDNKKRSFWKIGRIEQLIKGKDDVVRSAIITLGADDGKFGMKTLRRPLKLLVPLEVNQKRLSSTFQNPPTQLYSQQQPQLPSQPQPQPPLQQSDQSQPQSRPRRRAAVLGETIRRQVMH